MAVFNRKQWTMDTLTSNVKNGIITASQAAYWVNAYVANGFFLEADAEAFAAAVAEPEPVADIDPEAEI